MQGPHPLGHWSSRQAANNGKNYRHLKAGVRYCVVHDFCDHDGTAHPIGECWRFLGYSYLPYDDGLSLFVSLDDGHEWHLPLWNRAEGQKAIVSALADYIVEAR